MRIAFYAPMKPPGHPVPSGDRRLARLFMKALAHVGHDVQLLSDFRSWQAKADPLLQERLEGEGEAEAEQIIARMRRGDLQPPDLCFTYHLYYKAPDWIGPKVAAAFGIPYIVSEASLAYKRADGPWDRGHRAVLRALECSSAVINLNPLDAECLPDVNKLVELAPFLETEPYRLAAANRTAHRADLAEKLGLDAAAPWLLSVAMLRKGDKLASYRLLAKALESLEEEPWNLLIVGAGEAEGEVRTAFSPFPSGKVRFLGEFSEKELFPYYAAADLLVWPAVREAFGMAILEAQAAGLPVVAGAEPGVTRIVEDGKSGLLTPPGDVEAFANGVRRLICAAGERQRMAEAALIKSRAGHDIASAAGQLEEVLLKSRSAHG